jgi:hypothetical protein
LPFRARFAAAYGLSAYQRSHQYLHAAFAPQRKATPADLKHARTAGLQHLQPATGLHAHFREPSNKARFPSNFGHVGPLTGSQHI